MVGLAQPIIKRKAVPRRPEIAEPLAAIVPGTGTLFDHRIDLLDPEGTALVQRVLGLVKPAKRYRDDHVARVRKLLANALRGHWFRQPETILYFRKADATAYADKPRWMRHRALAKAVDALAAARLVDAIVGKRMPYYSRKRSWCASYRAMDRLIALANECGVSAASISQRLHADELVRLFGPKPAHVPIPFAPTVETRRWIAVLEAVNAFYRQQRLALELPAELAPWNAEWEVGGADYRLPEGFRTDLYRVFNNGMEADPCFTQGGRLYGGWWMAVPAPLRANITINEQPTVELDFAECHPRMLYHEQGLVGPDQLYAIPAITAYEKASGLPAGTYRPCLKWAMQVLINSKGRPNHAEQPGDIVFPPDYPLKEVLRLLEIEHQPIAKAFRTGAGMRLMRMESDIALEIVYTATAEGWTVLPIHDSFIATAERQERLTELMVENYVKRFGLRPRIK